MSQKNNNSFKEIFDEIKSSKKILLSLHDGPDGDSLGACTAMKYWLERDLKKKVTLISQSHMSDEFKLYPFYKEVEVGPRFDSRDLSEYDLVIFLDFGVLNYDYLGKEDFDTSSINCINIDHHRGNLYYGSLNYVDERAFSTCSILIDFFKKSGVKFDSELSSRLLLGIYTDSMGLTLRKEAILDAAFLVENGARYVETVQTLRYNVPLKMKKYFALATMKFKVREFLGCEVGYSVVSLEEVEGIGLTFSDARMAPNYLQEIPVDFLFTLQESEKDLKGSFRSMKKIDVSLFAKELGGGGHKFAAAFRLPKMDLKKAERKVFDAIKKVGVHREK